MYDIDVFIASNYAIASIMFELLSMTLYLVVIREMLSAFLNIHKHTISICAFR